MQVTVFKDFKGKLLAYKDFQGYQNFLRDLRTSGRTCLILETSLIQLPISHVCGVYNKHIYKHLCEERLLNINTSTM